MFIEGVPAPQGSKNAYQRGGHIVLVEASKKLKPWRDHVREQLQLNYDLGNVQSWIDEPQHPVGIQIIFAIPKPVSNKRVRPTTKPDIDKLCRAILDAGTGVIWKDDSQVVSLHAHKVWVVLGKPGVYIDIFDSNNDYITDAVL
jgi:crossover junction endodeoxyribonuclease RusA